MKKLVLLLIVGITYTTFSLDFTQFTLNVNYDGDSFILKAGYSDSTTIYYDEGYEKDIPSFPPPGGIIPGFRIIRQFDDLPDELIYSDSDYREVPENEIDTVEYRLEILGNREEGKDFYFVVPQGSKSKEVVEIRVVDIASKGNQIDSNIVDGNRLYVKNRFLEDFFIRAVYRKNPTSIVRNVEPNTIYYSNGIIKLDDKKYEKFELYNLAGNKIRENRYIENTIDINDIQNGVYFAYIYESDFVIRMIKIVKLWNWCD